MEGGGLQKITNLPLNFANPPYALINESPLNCNLVHSPLCQFEKALNVEIFVVPPA